MPWILVKMQPGQMFQLSTVKKYGKLPLTQVARHGRGFPTPDTCRIAIKIIISVKNNVFLYWQLLIILFADDRAKKIRKYTS